MGNMDLVTGYRGANHVTAANVGWFNSALFGTHMYVLSTGYKFAAAIVSGTTNSIQVRGGDLMLCGRHVHLANPIVLTISNGTAGYNRYDLIVARYSKNSSTGIEEVNLEVVEGTPTISSSPMFPAIDDQVNTSSVNSGMAADFALYKIRLTGTTIEAPVAMFSPVALRKISFGTTAPASVTGLSEGDIYIHLNV